MTNPQEEFSQLFERMYNLCNEHNWGDPFSYAWGREIHLANTLNHQISTTLSGADAIDEDGDLSIRNLGHCFDFFNQNFLVSYRFF